MQSMRGFLSRGKSHLSHLSGPTDIEQGASDSTRTSTLPIGAAATPEPLPTLISPTERLTTFRLLIGITNDRSFSNAIFASHRPAANVGIYTRVCNYETAAGRRYRWFSLLINLCLALQLVVAAALTALGAAGPTVVMANDQSAIDSAKSNKRSVTALGAINTVIAGFLTYLKGSGLPGRFKYYEVEWRRIREAIEQRERELSRPDCTLDVYQVISAIEAMYEDACQDIEASVPDSFHSPAKAQRARDGGSSGAAAMAALRGLPAKFSSPGHNGEMKEKDAQRAESGAESEHAYLAKMKELEARYGAAVENTVAQAVHHGRQGGDKAVQAASTLKEVESEVEHTARQVKSAADEVEEFARRRLGLGGAAAKEDKGHDGEKK